MTRFVQRSRLSLKCVLDFQEHGLYGTRTKNAKGFHNAQSPNNGERREMQVVNTATHQYLSGLQFKESPLLLRQDIACLIIPTWRDGFFPLPFPQYFIFSLIFLLYCPTFLRLFSSTPFSSVAGPHLV
jgi:hypothetical protein